MLRPSRRNLCIVAVRTPIASSPTSGHRCRNRHFLSSIPCCEVTKGKTKGMKGCLLLARIIPVIACRYLYTGTSYDDSHCDRLRSVRGLTVSEKNAETMLLQTRDFASRAPLFVIEAAGQRYKQTMQLLYLGGVIHEDADLMVEKKRRVRLMRACNKWFGAEL